LEQVLEDQNKNKEKCKTEEFHNIKIGFHRLKQLYMQLKSCCDTTSRMISDENIQKQVDKVVAGYFGNSFSKEDITRIFHTMNEKLHNRDLQTLSEAKVSLNNAGGHSNLGTDEIRNIVLEILKIYDADKTGRVDYALESAGK
jgi:uncharacterized protein YueI